MSLLQLQAGGYHCTAFLYLRVVLVLGSAKEKKRLSIPQSLCEHHGNSWIKK